MSSERYAAMSHENPSEALVLLYWEACAADDAFHREVRRQFPKASGDMRYWPSGFDAQTRAAAERKRLADDAYLKASAAARYDAAC